jgi:hypothetical protein
VKIVKKVFIDINNNKQFKTTKTLTMLTTEIRNKVLMPE